MPKIKNDSTASSTLPGELDFESAILKLGLIGFDATQERAVALCVARAGGAVEWQIGDLDSADAWFVNGARVAVLQDGSLQVEDGLDGRNAVRFLAQELVRPIAFSAPCDPELEPLIQFDLRNRDSVREALTAFEGLLRPKISQLWIASQLVRRALEPNRRVLHLVGHGILLAVVDRAGKVGVSRAATLLDLEAASWMGRPSSARYIPAAFVRTSFSELIWQYATRTKLDWLPPRYRVRPLYFRRAPKVAQNMVRDEHWTVLRELSMQAVTMDDLLRRTGMDESVLESVLGALYLAGSITTDAQRARTPSQVSTLGPKSLGPESMGLHSRMSELPELPPADHTVPAHLAPSDRETD